MQFKVQKMHFERIGNKEQNNICPTLSKKFCKFRTNGLTKVKTGGYIVLNTFLLRILVFLEGDAVVEFLGAFTKTGID